ncbi:MAG: lipid-transfer protein [Candidatus Binatia bacterium]
MSGPRKLPRSRQAAVVGIHALPYAKDIGMTERRSGALAILGALADAGLAPADVDAMYRYSLESTTEMEMARVLGVPRLRAFGEVHYGGGAGPPVLAHAALAIESGLADVAVVWRARNRGSGGRPWAGQLQARGQDQFEWPYHCLRPVDALAFHTRYWIHRYGWTPEVLGRVATTVRAHANRNPAAMMRDKPLTMEDYLAARMICDPLRLFDCCLETDGALAVVLTSAERAADLDAAPAFVHAYAMGSLPGMTAMTFWYTDEIGSTPNRYVAPELWKNSGLAPEDIDVCQIYDAFTSQIPIFFEEFGFCGEGEAPAYMAEGDNPPYNTSGGGLSEAYVHGFNLIVEAVRQVRGTSTSQVEGAKRALVTGGNVVPTGAVVLSKEPW